MSETATQSSSLFGGCEVSLDPRIYIKRTSVIVYLITFTFLYATVSSTILQEPGVYYLLLLLSLLLIGFWHEYELRKEAKKKDIKDIERFEVFPREHFKLNALPHQIFGGLIAIFVFFIIMMAFGHIASKGSAIQPVDFFQNFLLMVGIVGMVETVMLIVYVRVVWLGVFIFPFLFAFTHPMIAMNWTKGIFTPESILFFAYAVSHAFIFVGLFLARDYLKPKKNPEEKQAWKFFGGIMVAVYHGGINVIAIFTLITVSGVPLGGL